MPFIKIWVHLVWATKGRQALLIKDVRIKLFAHMRENAKEKNIHIDFINGHVDHIHCLVALDQEQTVSKVMQLLKGESSYWINKQKLTRDRFEWQTEYFAVSVSESGVNRVRDYIKNQEQHHQKKTFQQEYEEFMQKYGFVIISSSSSP